MKVLLFVSLTLAAAMPSFAQTSSAQTGGEVTSSYETVKVAGAVIVPGHGPIEHDRGHLRTITALLESIDRQVKAAVQAGLSLDETKKKVDISKWAGQFTAGIASRKRNFQQYFATPVVEVAYKQAKGEATTESPF